MIPTSPDSPQRCRAGPGASWPGSATAGPRGASAAAAGPAGTGCSARGAVVAGCCCPCRGLVGSSAAAPCVAAHRRSPACSCPWWWLMGAAGHGRTCVGRGGRSISTSKPNGPRRARLSMSRSWGSPVREECLVRGRPPRDAVVQESITSPLVDEGILGVYKVLICMPWAVTLFLCLVSSLLLSSGISLGSLVSNQHPQVIVYNSRCARVGWGNQSTG